MVWHGACNSFGMAADGPPAGMKRNEIMFAATSFTQKILASVTALAASFVLITAAAGPIVSIA